MFCKLSVINDLFNCYKLPVIILDINFSVIAKYNYTDKLNASLNNTPIINDIKSIEFKPSTLSFSYKKLNYSCICFYNCYKTPLYFIIGPYKMQSDSMINKDNILVVSESSLKHILKLYSHILNCNFTYDKNSQNYSPLISRAIKYIEENYTETITINDLCDSYKINKCYFCNLFKKETGYTFINYLNNYKVEKSKELLKNLSLSLLDVSLAVGYNNQSYYSTIFKKFTGITPLEYRANIIKGNSL